ncbi:cupredoxin domain-containing protein [Aquibacillus kalidii]|uniref:cytochrome C oxidase subunit II n=1 Tax=Aquibacillus kalidii TaxID=2762597 RepID=UPI001648FF8C|nr:cytochrome C oxidase subunit II [Aquibacillus kalidii]
MKKVMLTIILSALVFFLAACGGNDSDSSNTSSESGSGTPVDLVASNWEFDQDTYTVPAGDVTFNLKNKEGFHGIKVEGTDVTIEGEGSATTNLEAGEYTIRCVVPCGTGHAEMSAKLVVE